MNAIQTLFKYEYFAKPEGQDPVNKVMGLLKMVLPVGFFVSYTDVMLISKCTSIGQILNTTGYWIVPLTGMCLSFSSVTYISTKLRKKDDMINYFFGVLSSSYILHKWQKSFNITYTVTLLMMYYAFTKKHGVFSFKPNQPAHKNNIFFERNLNDVTQYKWFSPWRNVPYKNYHLSSKYNLDRESYYINF